MKRNAAVSADDLFYFYDWETGQPRTMSVAEARDNGLVDVLGAETTAGAQAKVDALSTAMVPITVLNKTERLALEDTIVGVTRVIQSDQPGILWQLKGVDDWYGVPYTTNEDGDIIVSMELANVAGTVPDLNVLGVSGGIPSIGDGITSGGRKVMMNTKPDGYVMFTSVKTSTVTVRIKQTGATGFCWSANGGAPTYVAVADGVLSALINLSDPDGSPREFSIWPATSATSGRVGDLTYLYCNNNNLTTLDVSGLTALTRLYCPDNNNLTTLDVSGLTALTFLDCNTNHLTTLDVSGLTALTSLYCQDNNLTTLDVSGLTALTFLNCNTNHLTTLDVSGLTALTNLYCQDNPSLAQITATGFDGVTPYGSTLYAVNLENCGLTTDAIWSMLNQMAVAGDNPSYIKLVGNPCDKADGATTPEMLTDGETYTEADVSTLLTAKGYSLILTDGTLAP